MWLLVGSLESEISNWLPLTTLLPIPDSRLPTPDSRFPRSKRTAI
ncbi:hypothetical protein BJP36_36580 [Moorena producens JHB]|uniref:Uncharacterized protein n=1 Tax=Moorena producens (strain JHB) TaxID=1454205 RepID=A0A9Q9SU10_MOOP1|nr:hypothetical protein [Moorena producens]WAN69611.1 hypothetical protein BJP36_36580 [Moorena producens JHB]